MNYKLAKPILIFVGFILIVGLACGTSTPEEPAPVAEVASPVPSPPTSPPPNTRACCPRILYRGFYWRYKPVDLLPC